MNDEQHDTLCSSYAKNREVTEGEAGRLSDVLQISIDSIYVRNYELRISYYTDIRVVLVWTRERYRNRHTENEGKRNLFSMDWRTWRVSNDWNIVLVSKSSSSSSSSSTLQPRCRIKRRWQWRASPYKSLCPIEWNQRLYKWYHLFASSRSPESWYRYTQCSSSTITAAKYYKWSIIVKYPKSSDMVRFPSTHGSGDYRGLRQRTWIHNQSHWH